MTPQEQAEISEALKKVPTAGISGHLYKKNGLRTRCLSGVRPLDGDKCSFAGPAYTLRFVPQREDLNFTTDLATKDSPALKAMQEIPEGAVLIIDMQGNSSVGALGDVLVTNLMVRGVVGVVADGGMRDTKEIKKLGLPVHCSGPAAPPFPSGLMPADVQCVIGCGGVSVFPGDFVVADEDGVVIVPAELAREVAEEAAAKELQDAWSQEQVAGGSGVWGTYPPNEEAIARFKETLKDKK